VIWKRKLILYGSKRGAETKEDEFKTVTWENFLIIRYVLKKKKQ
jgi:hypothetical protein